MNTQGGKLTVKGVEFSSSTWPLRDQDKNPARRARDGHIVLNAEGALYFYGPGDEFGDLIGYVYLGPDWEDVESEEAPTEADWLKAFAYFEETWER